MSAREAFFADAAFGQRFCIVNRPSGQPRGLVLLVPPLLEELNKSRRMCALAAHALADAGLLVLRMDLHGCGDSSGDLADASWVTWIADVEHSAAWLRSQADGPLFIWAVRGGALLAGDWLARGGGCDGLMLWHPVLEGRRNLVQLLRLAAVAHWQDEHKAGASASALLARLEQGAGAEVAGYVISPKLAKGWSSSRLELPPGFAAPVAVMEMAASGDVQPNRALGEWVARWSGAGQAVLHEKVTGPFFWQTQEIEVSPALIDASCAVLGRWVHAR